MKILFIPDVKEWAIGHLVQAKVENMPYHDCVIYPVHPRDAQNKAQEFYGFVNSFKPDVIVYEYFRSAEQLINAQPDLKRYKSILVHHNQKPKALFHADWNELGINHIVTHTKKATEVLKEKGYENVSVINHGIDVNFFEYLDKEPEEHKVGYVGRIVPWKGLKEIATASKELGHNVQVMGKIDKPKYWEEISKENLSFDFFNCSDEERVNAYHSMTIYVGNSEDNYEEGTLPYLEAMACGVPVITTPNGVANDIAQDRINALVVDFNDYEGLKNAIDELMNNEELRNTLRKNAWNTVKNMTEQKMALQYSNLFWEIVYPDEELVSVIIPMTWKNEKEVKEILKELSNQTHSVLEAIVVVDEEITSDMGVEKFIKWREKLQKQFKGLALKVMATDKEGYNLAMARNLAVIEAEGEYLMFCDSRLAPENEAISVFVQSLANINRSERYWLFGDKGSGKKSFVENFSFVRRKDFLRFGMFCERINEYGGLSQETRTRWISQGGQLNYMPLAKGYELKKSSLSNERRQQITNMKFKLYQMYDNNTK